MCLETLHAQLTSTLLLGDEGSTCLSKWAGSVRYVTRNVLRLENICFAFCSIDVSLVYNAKTISFSTSKSFFSIIL